MPAPALSRRRSAGGSDPGASRPEDRLERGSLTSERLPHRREPLRKRGSSVGFFLPLFRSFEPLLEGTQGVLVDAGRRLDHRSLHTGAQNSLDGVHSPFQAAFALSFLNHSSSA